MEGAKIRGKEIGKGAFTVIWVGDADSPNQNRGKEPKTRCAETGVLRDRYAENRTWPWIGNRGSNRSLGSLTGFYFGSE